MPRSGATGLTDGAAGRGRSGWLARAASLPAQPVAPAHVFDTRAWLEAWEQTTIEPTVGAAYLDRGDGSAATPYYCVAASPFWDAYEIEAGLGPVWRGPVVFSPSVYSTYGARLTDPGSIHQAVDGGLARAAGWGAGALLFANMTAADAQRWARQRPPATAIMLDTAHRAVLRGSVEEHLAGIDGRVRREFRRQRRRARERGLSLLELRGHRMRPRLAEFQRLASATSKRHSADMYDLRTFEALSDVPGSTLLTAERDGRMLGAFLAFGYRERLYLWTAGLDYDALKEFGTYAFLMYESLDFAVREGHRVLEVGRGNSRFKERHGFRGAELWTLVYLTDRWAQDRALARRLSAMGRGLREHLGLA
jgi:hypothetical protein